MHRATINTDRIKKLLWLTQSDNDNEALSSIRNINKMLKEHQKTWDDVFNFEQVIEKIVYKAPQETKEKLHWCLENCGENQRGFLESLSAGFMKWGSLTPRQKYALDKICNQINS